MTVSSPFPPIPPFPSDPQAFTQLLTTLAGQNGEPAREFMRLLSGHTDSAPWAKLQTEFAQQQVALWTSMLARESGSDVAPVIAPEKGDRRFSSEEWRTNPAYDYLKQSYLLNSKYLSALVDHVQVDERTRARLGFFVRQIIDATSPANFAAMNPDVLRAARESEGETLSRGISNLIADMEKGRISLTDESAFEVGRNIAVSEGAVVFENDLVQLIQYAPLTPQVGTRPLLIVPPCINKYYILDLQPENSFVRYAVEQGQTVFMVSWRNAGAGQSKYTWDDYVELGVIAPLAASLEISGAAELNALGFCIGGTLLASALSVLRSRAKKKSDFPVASLTLLTTMLDYVDAGEIGLFIDEQSVKAREAAIGRGGLMQGKELAFVFSSLRPNDLIWPYIVNNYLKGKTPDAFDLLYWNADSTNLAGPMYCWYLRNLYLANKLRVPGALTMCGVPVDLSTINVPTFLLGSREDHIVPWKSAYASTQLLRGDLTFVLAASGHIAGVVNPAAKNKRSHWKNSDLVANPDEWLAHAEEVPGSWWSQWAAWLKPKAGKQIPARKKTGNKAYPPIEPAPGRYVKERAA